VPTELQGLLTSRQCVISNAPSYIADNAQPTINIVKWKSLKLFHLRANAFLGEVRVEVSSKSVGFIEYRITF